MRCEKKYLRTKQTIHYCDKVFRKEYNSKLVVKSGENV